MEDTPDKIIRQFLYTFSVSKAEFSRLSGVSKKSIFKYLNGLPVHHLKAKQMAEAMWKHYKHYVPVEKLMYKK